MAAPPAPVPALPLAPPPPTPYVTDPAFLREWYSRNAASDPESRTSGVMNCILNYYFPSTEGYVHRPEDYVVSGYVDINTHQWVPAAPLGVAGTLQPPVTAVPEVQAHFLITQCKAAKHEQNKAHWDEGEEQMDKYMRSMSGINAWACPIYGMVAVGRLVRFYKWENGSRKWWGTRKYDVFNDAHIIHNRLVLIKNNHT